MAEFQNQAGNWQRIFYACRYNLINPQIIELGVEPYSPDEPYHAGDPSTPTARP